MLTTPWHKGIWGVAYDRGGATHIFARFAKIDHFLRVDSAKQMESTRCEDGDTVMVDR